MRITDFLGNLIKKQTGSGETITIEIPTNLYYKQMAVYTAVNLIANAISMSEILTFKNHSQVCQEEYYTFNVAPNANQTSSQFWHKVIEEMLAGQCNPGTALVVGVNGQLYCADSYSIEQERPIRGNIYSQVTVDNFTFDKKFTAKEVYLFKLSKKSIINLINDMYVEYSKLIDSAASSFRSGNGKKYKLKIAGIKVGDEEFNKNFENVIKKQLENYMNNDNAIYPEFDGYDLQEDKAVSGKNSDDFIKLRKDMFEMVASSFNIPLALMTGNITNINDIVSEFLTFGVDPIADMITETLNKEAGYENYAVGNYYKVKTASIYHRDIFSLAPEIDKLVSSGFFSIDEARKEAGYEELNNSWSKQHFMTKNYEEIERLLKTVEGGE